MSKAELGRTGDMTPEGTAPLAGDEKGRESSNAIEKVATELGTSVELVRSFGGYLAEVFGTVPHDAVGLLGGDWLKIRRMENFARIRELSKEILDERAVADPELVDTIAWVLTRHEIDYKRPAFLGDEITIRTWVGSATPVRFERHVEIADAEGRVLVKSRTLWSPVDRETSRLKRLDVGAHEPFYE